MRERSKARVPQKRHTAIHEAGHAVIGRKLRMICGGVTIVADFHDGTAGYGTTGDPHAIWYAWEQRGKLREFASCYRGRIMTYMAGAEAETVILGRCVGGDGDDRYQIDLMAEEAFDASDDYAQWHRYEPRMRRQVRRLIRHHKPVIERVAAALLKRKTLEKEEIDALVTVSGSKSD
jgi:ATP-dependent Zn protease